MIEHALAVPVAGVADAGEGEEVAAAKRLDVVHQGLASRMVTTSLASSPSRSPISRLGTLSAQVMVTKVRLT